MKVRVKKTSENKNTYDTAVAELDGMPFKPEVGKALILESSTHEKGGIVTSLVQEVEKTDTGYVVKTMNSTYVVDVVQ